MTNRKRNRKLKMWGTAIWRLLVLVVLTGLALETLWVALNLIMHLIDVDLGLDPTGAKLAMYNSGSWYTRWLSQLTNDLVRMPVALVVMASPFLYYNNLQNKMRARMRAQRRRRNARVYN